MRKIAHIVILVSFLLGVIAPACGFSWGGKFSVIEICTDRGVESRIVENTQNDPKAPNHQDSEQCQFCFQSANVNDYILPASKVTVQLSTLKTLQIHHYQSIVLSRTETPQSLRGPPSLI